jgi:hypothetical protein
LELAASSHKENKVFNGFNSRRRKWQARIVPKSKPREELEALYGKVWDVRQLATEFVITAIIASEVVVRRKTDDVVGTLQYQNNFTLYYNFQPQPKEG